MFDRISVSPGGGTSYSHSKSEIREFKAPTDDSIRLLGEMEEKARKRIVEAVEVDNNVISGMMYVLEPDYLGAKYRFLAKVNINGKNYTIDEAIDFFDIQRSQEGITELLRILYKRVSDKIAEDLMNAVIHTTGFKQMVRQTELKEKPLEAKSDNYSNVELV